MLHFIEVFEHPVKLLLLMVGDALRGIESGVSCRAKHGVKLLYLGKEAEMAIVRNLVEVDLFCTWRSTFSPTLLH